MFLPEKMLLHPAINLGTAAMVRRCCQCRHLSCYLIWDVKGDMVLE